MLHSSFFGTTYMYSLSCLLSNQVIKVYPLGLEYFDYCLIKSIKGTYEIILLSLCIRSRFNSYQELDKFQCAERYKYKNDCTFILLLFLKSI